MPKSAPKVSSTAAATASSGGGSRKRKATTIQNGLKIKAPKRLQSDAPKRRTGTGNASGKRQRASSDEHRRNQLSGVIESRRCCAILLKLLSMIEKENAEVEIEAAVPHQKHQHQQKKKKSFNTNLETVKHDLQAPFEDLIFRDIPDGVYADKYEKDENNFVLYRTDSSAGGSSIADSETDGGVVDTAPSNKIVIVQKTDGVMRANINFAMGLMTKVYANSTKFPVTGVENVRQGYNVPLNMYRILCYDASEELNPQFIMKNKDKIFTKKELSPRDSRIFQFWGEMIDVGNSAEESLKQLIPFLKQNDLYIVKPTAPPKSKATTNVTTATAVDAAVVDTTATAAGGKSSKTSTTSSEGEEEEDEDGMEQDKETEEESETEQ